MFKTAHRVSETQLKPDARLEIVRPKRRRCAELSANTLRARKAAEFGRGPLAEQQRHLRHAFGSADDEDAPATGAHFFISVREGFQAAGAIAMNCHRRHVLGNSGAQRDDPRDVGRVGRLGDTAKDHFIHQRRLEGSAHEQRGHGGAPQVHRIKRARSVPALQNGVRTPSMIARRGFMRRSPGWRR
jgi:hypothetical protein